MQACNPQANPSAALLELYRTAFDSYLQWWTALLPGTRLRSGSLRDSRDAMPATLRLHAGLGDL